jgi:hypothetical protein
MSQLQSVLRRSVAHLDPSDHDGRDRVFVNAREAMIRLLWSYDPPLSPREIDSKIDEFDDIVTQILGESAAVEPAEDEEEPDDEGEEADIVADAPAEEAEAQPVEAPARKAEPVALSERHAEALAILRRPARFEPMSQIGSPTPAAKELPAPAATPPTDSALLAKLAVEKALARLNGRLAPVEDEMLAPPAKETRPDEDDDSDDLEALDDLEEAEEAAEETVQGDDPAEDDVDDRDGDDPDLEDEDDFEPEDDAEGADPEDELADVPDEDLDEEPEDELDDEDLDDARDRREDPDEDEEDDAPLAARRADDEDHDESDLDDLFEDEAAQRPTLGERLRALPETIGGKTIAAVAAAAILLVGGIVGTIYLTGDRAPQQVAAAPEPTAPEPSVPEPVVPEPTPAAPPVETEEAATSTPAPAEPPAAPAPAEIPSGALALETLSLFDGRDPSVFQSAPGNPIRFEGDTLGGFARIASSSNSTGSRITVGRGVFERLAGRTVRVVVVARAAATDPASSLRFSYQNGRSLSPWQDSALGADYAPLSLTWTVPKERGGPETDAIMIEPGIPGDGTAADVSSVRIEILK